MYIRIETDLGLTPSFLTPGLIFSTSVKQLFIVIYLQLLAIDMGINHSLNMFLNENNG